jgi:hypothetical protein
MPQAFSRTNLDFRINGGKICRLACHVARELQLTHVTLGSRRGHQTSNGATILLLHVALASHHDGPDAFFLGHGDLRWR